MSSSVTFGLPLAGDPADAAALAVLVEAAPDLVEGPWSCVQDANGPGSVLCSAGIDLARALRLARRGLEVVALSEGTDALALTPVGDDRPAQRWTAPLRREAAHMIEALRPRRLPGEPLVDEALFVLPAESSAARVLLERLLLLERGDVQVCSFTDPTARSSGPDGARERFAVRVKHPPIYLLMTARDDEAAGAAVYARHAATPLWVAWSYEHPLAGPAAAALAKIGHTALVDRHGAWLRLPGEWRTRSIYDALTPVFTAPYVDLVPSDTDLRFEIRIRLAPGPVTDADLWLLTPDQLLDLEPLIEACTADELGRLTVARLADPDALRTGQGGALYLLRERVRPGAARMAARVSETLLVPGYTGVAGADNLYIPAGRRLVPLLRRDDLRRLLGLDRAHTVVITEDRDGPRIVTVTSVEETPLQRWIDYVATDRRLELDRLLERSVFEFPDVTIDWPELPRAALERPPPRESRQTPTHRRHPAAPVPAAAAEPEAAAGVDADLAARLAALRERARELERGLVGGGVDDPGPWQELAAIKQRLGDPDEAAACYESALLHAGPPYDVDVAAALASVDDLSPETASDDTIAELVVSDRRTPADSARLGALVVARLAAGRPPHDEVMQLALPLFADPRLPVSRRLAWVVLSAWYHHARDRLGLTRAKESIVGGINERGLSELHDLPRFVRQALAREGDDAHEPGLPRGDRLQQGQLVALEALWHDVLAAGLPDIDVLAAYTRLTFAVGFARLGARAHAQELVAPLDREMDVHEVPNRALFRLYLARLAHETAGSSPEAWAADAQKIVDAVREPGLQRAVAWLQKRSMWLRSEQDEPLVGRPTRFKLPAHLEVEAIGEHLAREMAPGAGNFDFIIAEAVDVCLRRALASGSDALVASVLHNAEPNLANIHIPSHRAEAVGTCIHGAACLGDSAMLGRLLDALVDIARNPQLGSVRELTRAVERGFVALRRFGGLDPARGLLEALSGVHPHTVSDRCQLLATVAKGFVQIGEERTADALVDRVIGQLLAGNLDYVTRAQVGLAVAGALRHWPNVARVERFRKFMAALPLFRDTFTTGKYYDTHRILMLEAIVDSLADSHTRHSDRIQGFLDQEEHALRRRIQTDVLTALRA
ncbi:MAG: hypothetical protein JNL82_34100 [Myxococcales bacterium]|nr:hypothetical protein [Myxococcales bacterium]